MREAPDSASACTLTNLETVEMREHLVRQRKRRAKGNAASPVTDQYRFVPRVCPVNVNTTVTRARDRTGATALLLSCVIRVPVRPVCVPCVSRATRWATL